VADLSYDPDAFLIGFAIVVAGAALLVVFIVLASDKFSKSEAPPYVSQWPARVGAMIVDITIISLLVELLVTTANPSYDSLILSLFIVFLFNPLAITLFIVAFCLSSFLFFYMSFFSVTGYSLASILMAIISFLYFFIFEAFFEGKTVGRFIFRLKTLHESKIRSLRVDEAGINAIGKTFLLIDLLIGFLVINGQSRLRQIRLSQRAAGAITVSISFEPQLLEDKSGSILEDESTKSDGWDFK